MPSRRQNTHDYYAVPENLREQVAKGLIDRAKLSGVPDATGRYRFRGAQQVDAAVVRLDLNGYSKWARERTLEQRAAQLDIFFSGVVPLLDQHGGVYFRDEGDCIVCLFSTYFGTLYDWKHVTTFSRNVVKTTFGALTAKACISVGSVAIFQKAHERGTEDWSAEGEPFVRAARLEAAIDSTQRVHCFADEYQRFRGQLVAPGGTYHWEISSDSKQIPGLGLPGGWTDLVFETFIPGGRVQQ